MIWAAAFEGSDADRLPASVQALIARDDAELHFSVVSLWETAIKHGLERRDFRTDPHRFRRGLLDGGYVELPISGVHAAAVASLPAIHKDPFDRLLVAQATVEGLLLLTSDRALSRYPGPIQLV